MTRKRRGTARWQGDLDTGEGTLTTESGVLQAAFDAASRFSDGEQTNPEELIGAAHAACYSMALTGVLEEEGYEPDNVRTDADVELDPEGPTITAIHLATHGRSDEIDEETFADLARRAKDECLVSGIFGDLSIDVEASLETPTPG